MKKEKSAEKEKKSGKNSKKKKKYIKIMAKVWSFFPSKWECVYLFVILVTFLAITLLDNW